MVSPSVTARPVPTSVTIEQPMNDHGTVTVVVTETNETRHLVDYSSDRVRSTLESLPSGTTIPVEMSRVGSRSNVWRVTGFAGVPHRPEA
jgi:hypothetical protein